MRRIPRELRPLAKVAQHYGWVISVTGAHHLKWSSPTGAFVISAGTPSDQRAVQRHKILLRHAGLPV
jgi:hypothetical protein